MADVEAGEIERDRGVGARSWGNYAWRMRVKIGACFCLGLILMLIVGIILLFTAERLQGLPGKGDINGECADANDNKHPEISKECHPSYHGHIVAGVLLVTLSVLGVLIVRKLPLRLPIVLFLRKILFWTHENWCFGHRVSTYDLIMTKGNGDNFCCQNNVIANSAS